jgi:hypothetical protein
MDILMKKKKKDTTKSVKLKGTVLSSMFNIFLDTIFGLITIILSITTDAYMEYLELDYNNVTDLGMDLELERLIELRYLDDYLEEPVEIEISNNLTYIDLFKGFFKQESNTFYNLFSNIRHFTNEVKHYISTKSLSQHSVNTTVDRVLNERPQVMTTLLKHHLDEASNNISILNDKVTAS